MTVVCSFVNGRSIMESPKSAEKRGSLPFDGVLTINEALTIAQTAFLLGRQFRITAQGRDLTHTAAHHGAAGRQR